MVGGMADETEAVSRGVSSSPTESDKRPVDPRSVVCCRYAKQPHPLPQEGGLGAPSPFRGGLGWGWNFGLPQTMLLPLTQLFVPAMRLCWLDWEDLCADSADARIVADRNATARAQITMTATITLVSRFLDIIASYWGLYHRAKRS